MNLHDIEPSQGGGLYAQEDENPKERVTVDIHRTYPRYGEWETIFDFYHEVDGAERHLITSLKLPQKTASRRLVESLCEVFTYILNN